MLAVKQIKNPVFIIGLMIITGIFFVPLKKSEFAAGQNGYPEKFTVEITENGFYPDLIEIKPSDFIIFMNKSGKASWPASDPHPTHEFLNGFDPLQEISKGSSFEFRFFKAGEWKYHDHLSIHKRGAVIVLAGEQDYDAFKNGIKNAEWQNNFFFENLQNFFQDLYVFLPTDFLNSTRDSPPEIKKLLKETNPQKQALIVRQTAEKYGPKRALELMKKSGLPFTGETHLLIHEVGDVAYEKFGLDALKYCDESFLSACFHGVILNMIGDKGIDGLARMVGKCKEAGIHVFTQCSHAAGHGFLAWKQYNVLEALPLCDELGKIDKTIPLFNCYDGVFMENIFGVHEGKPSLNRMVKPDDPYYPCNVVPEKYQEGCWADQATLMYQLFNGDIQRVAEHCDTLKNAGHKRICYDNFARQIHPLTEGKTERAVEFCKNATGEWQDQCLITLVDAAFSVGDRERMPYEICESLKNSGNKDLCYERLLGNIASYGDTEDKKNYFCSKIKEKERQLECGQKFGTADTAVRIDELERTAKRYGSSYGYEMLKKTSVNPVKAHDGAHLIGKLAYQELGLKGFSICDNAFAFGCYHGIFEAMINKEGIGAIGRARTECLTLTPWGRAISCIHGIGHGIKAHKVNLSSALKLCDDFPDREKIYCFDGVFMEYYTGTMADTGKLDSQIANSWDFCLSLSTRHQEQCARNHTFYLLSRYGDDPSIPSACGGLPENIRGICVQSIGLKSGQSHQANTDLCDAFNNQDDRAYCVTSAAQEFAFEGRADADAICAKLSLPWESRCVQTVKDAIDLYN